MLKIAPRPFLLGGFQLPVTGGRVWFTRQFPIGAIYRVKYLLADYPREVVNGAQISPELSFVLYDQNGRAFGQNPIVLSQVTSPAGADGLNATQAINVDYPGGSGLKIEIIGQNPATGLPPWVSLTVMGMMGWGSYGGRY